jgi:hypothetical protein
MSQPHFRYPTALEMSALARIGSAAASPVITGGTTYALDLSAAAYKLKQSHVIFITSSGVSTITVGKPLPGDVLVILAQTTQNHVVVPGSGVTITEMDGQANIATNIVLDAAGEYAVLCYRATNTWQILKTTGTQT